MTVDGERGSRTFRSLTGHDPTQFLAPLRARSPQMYRRLIEGAFSQPLADQRLCWRDREVANVAVLSALGGAQPQLRVHLEAALSHDVTADELRALVEHTSVYAGFPRALSALDVVDEVLGESADATPIPVRGLALSDHTTQLAHLGGSGPAVVLLHALGLTWQMWDPVIRGLARGRRVYAYDLRGHGAASDAPAPGDLTVLADDLFEILAAAGLDAAHVVGLSYGGGIAQTFAARHPHGPPVRLLRSASRRGGEGGRRCPGRTVAHALVSPEALAENRWGVRYARETVLRGDAGQVAAAWRAFSRLDVAGALRHWERPALVLCGECDASTGPMVMRRVVENVGGAGYVQMPGAPHMPTLETPHLVTDALDRFLPSTQFAGLDRPER